MRENSLPILSLCRGWPPSPWRPAPFGLPSVGFAAVKGESLLYLVSSAESQSTRLHCPMPLSVFEVNLNNCITASKAHATLNAVKQHQGRQQMSVSSGVQGHHQMSFIPGDAVSGLRCSYPLVELVNRSFCPQFGNWSANVALNWREGGCEFVSISNVTHRPIRFAAFGEINKRIGLLLFIYLARVRSHTFHFIHSIA